MSSLKLNISIPIFRSVSLRKVYHTTMNKSTLFQPVGGVVLSGKLPRRFPAFLAVWGGQTERETPLCNIKLHAARFVVCVGLVALVGVLLGISGKSPFEVGVVGADMDKGIFLVKSYISGLFLFGKV